MSRKWECLVKPIHVLKFWSQYWHWYEGVMNAVAEALALAFRFVRFWVVFWYDCPQIPLHQHGCWCATWSGRMRGTPSLQDEWITLLCPPRLSCFVARTAGSGTLCFHLNCSRFPRQPTWKWISFLACRLLAVQVSRTYKSDGKIVAAGTLRFVDTVIPRRWQMFWQNIIINTHSVREDATKVGEYVHSASCAHALGSMFVCYSLFVCLFDRQFRWLGVVKGRFMIAAWKAVFLYFSNVWWDHIPDANCSGVKGEHCHGFWWF